MRRFPQALIPTTLLAGFGLWALTLSVLGTELRDQAGRMIEYFALEAELGLRWTPSPAEAKRLELFLGKSLNELYLIKAPFERSVSSVVSTESLTWMILAELAYAKALTAQGSSKALAFLYLASCQVGFARQALRDPESGLYHPRWQEGHAFGVPQLRDQLLMLWALASYSRSGKLLGNEQSAQVFYKQTRSLADELAQAIQATWPDAAALAARDPLSKALYIHAQRAYEGLSPIKTSQQQVLQGQDEAQPQTLTLRALAEQATILAATQLSALPTLWEEPAVQALLSQDIPWPAAMIIDLAADVWRVSNPVLETAPAMALAFWLLQSAPMPVTTTPARLQDSEGMKFEVALIELVTKLSQLSERLQSLEQQLAAARAKNTLQEEKDTTAVMKRVSYVPASLTPAEALVLGPVGLLSVATLMLQLWVWRRKRRKRL